MTPSPASRTVLRVWSLLTAAAFATALWLGLATLVVMPFLILGVIAVARIGGH